MFNGGGKRSRFAVLTDPNSHQQSEQSKLRHLLSVQRAGAATPASCDSRLRESADVPELRLRADRNLCRLAGRLPDDTCGTGPCTYYVDENGLYATYNTVKPTFSALSMTDNFRPTDQLLFNFGFRQDTYTFEGSSTSPNDPARQFFFAAFNKENCQEHSNRSTRKPLRSRACTRTSCARRAQYREISGRKRKSIANASGRTPTTCSNRASAERTRSIQIRSCALAPANMSNRPTRHSNNTTRCKKTYRRFLGGAFYKFGFFTRATR